MKIYLVGVNIKPEDEYEHDKRALSEAKNKKVFVLDLTTSDKNKLAKYRNFLTQYFQKIGAESVEFISSSKKEEIEKKMEESGLVYIPGGNTELLLQNLVNRKLVPIIKSLNSVILANSAGALALCNKVILTKDEDNKETKVLEGIDIVPFAVDVHYTEAHDPELVELSRNIEIFAIPEKSAIVYDGSIHYMGKIVKFHHGKKENL